MPYKNVFCAKCGQQCAIINEETTRLIDGAYFEGIDGCNYCKKCYGVKE